MTDLNWSRAKNGYRFCAISYDDITRWGGHGYCDICDKQLTRLNGFLIPISNACYCSECFNEWELTVKFNCDDVGCESKIMRCYEKILDIKPLKQI